jgi:hypothetical protein
MMASVHAYAANRADAIAFFDLYHRNYLQMLGRLGELGRDGLNRQFREGISLQRETLAPYVEEAWNRLCVGACISEPIDLLSAAMRRTVPALKALLSADRVPESTKSDRYVRGIVSSYVHMMNNRLGVAIDEEAYLASACATALRIEQDADDL